MASSARQVQAEKGGSRLTYETVNLLQLADPGSGSGAAARKAAGGDSLLAELSVYSATRPQNCTHRAPASAPPLPLPLSALLQCGLAFNVLFKLLPIVPQIQCSDGPVRSTDIRQGIRQGIELRDCEFSALDSSCSKCYACASALKLKICGGAIPVQFGIGSS
ncbi:hypothetical protein B0H17DRAFT_1127280 [Mycena rosella]|uniref:Uncharacterized protein n=1 Tax=Mycena rosella TaxID=1033263 RepID=A0AAD7GRJ2_MYCRO|nr:hypothetical protein B0H17DRAFT_1127280 [Mycena rosella]